MKFEDLKINDVFEFVPQGWEKGPFVKTGPKVYRLKEFGNVLEFYTIGSGDAEVKELKGE